MRNGVSFWTLLRDGMDDNDIEWFVVPVIQRDYAQGRTDEKASTIRRRFLNSIGDALTMDAGEPLSLDFIYGAKSGTQIELIDGQQRFTTLFLIHWYLAGRAGMDESVFAILKKFTYRARTASREFCAKLCEHQQSVFAKANRVSAFAAEERKARRTKHPTGIFTEIVRDAVWFVKSWETDPTVISMLRMLDDIAEHEQINRDCTGAWYKLAGEDAPITFQFLSIDQFGNSEDLYIKMNSRGKPLTSFENFKALFGKHLENIGEQALCEQFWANIDGAWSQTFWEFIQQRYRTKGITVDEYFFQIDETVLKYIWLQVEMYSGVINAAQKEPPDFYSDSRVLLRFEHIDDPKHRDQDWSTAIFAGKRPEQLVVESLVNAADILTLLEELFDGDDRLETWRNTSFIDRLFLLQTWNATREKPEGVIGTGNDDYFIRMLAFVVIFWCSAYGLPRTPQEKARLIGYLRAVRNCLQRYRSKKSGKRYWDPELDKKNYGKAMSLVLSQMLDPDTDCLDRLANAPEAVFGGISYFAAEAEKCRILQGYSEGAKANSLELEDTPLLQGSILPLLDEDGPILTKAEYDALFAEDRRMTLAKALLACGDENGYFAIPSGESGNNRSRVAFCDEAFQAWSVALLYARDDFSKRNVAVLKALVERCRNGETPEDIAAAYVAQCEQRNAFSWRYYLIRYADCIFRTGGAVSIAGRALLDWPTFDLYYGEDWYACRTAYVMARFREDNTCNVFLIMAAQLLCNAHGMSMKDSFVGGKEAVFRLNDRRIRAVYDHKTKSFVLSDDNASETVIPSDNENIVLALVDAVERMLRA